MFNENAVQWLTLQSQYLIIYVAQLNYCLLFLFKSTTTSSRDRGRERATTYITFFFLLFCGSENRRPDCNSHYIHDEQIIQHI